MITPGAEQMYSFSLLLKFQDGARAFSSILLKDRGDMVHFDEPVLTESGPWETFKCHMSSTSTILNKHTWAYANAI